MKKGPPTSVRSIRLPDTTWAALDVEAKRRATSVNAMMAGAAEALAHPGLAFRISEGQKAIREMERRREPAVHVDVPLFVRPKFNPQQKTGKAKR